MTDGDFHVAVLYACVCLGQVFAFWLLCCFASLILVVSTVVVSCPEVLVEMPQCMLSGM